MLARRPIASQRVLLATRRPTALLVMPVISCRLSVVMLCMLATFSQLILRSVPFVTVVGDAGMAAEYSWDEAEVGMVTFDGCVDTAATHAFYGAHSN